MLVASINLKRMRYPRLWTADGEDSEHYLMGISLDRFHLPHKNSRAVPWVPSVRYHL